MSIVEIRGDMQPIRDALRLLSDLGFSRLVVEAPGQEHKVEAAIKRLDTIPAEAIKDALRDTLEELWGDAESYDPFEMADACAEAVAEAVQDAILAGEVQGPPRSDAWVARKGHDTNLVGLTEELVNAIEGRAER